MNLLNKNIQSKQMLLKRLFYPGSDRVEKSHLIKSIYQLVLKVLQDHGSSPDKPRFLVLTSTGVASINPLMPGGNKMVTHT